MHGLRGLNPVGQGHSRRQRGPCCSLRVVAAQNVCVSHRTSVRLKVRHLMTRPNEGFDSVRAEPVEDFGKLRVNGISLRFYWDRVNTGSPRFLWGSHLCRSCAQRMR